MVSIEEQHVREILERVRSEMDEQGEEYEKHRDDVIVEIAERGGTPVNEDGTIADEAFSSAEDVLESLTVWDTLISVDNSMSDPEEIRLIRYSDGSLVVTHDSATEIFYVPLMGDEVDYESIVFLLFEILQDMIDEEEGLMGQARFEPSNVVLEEGQFYPINQFEFLNSLFELDRLRAFFPEAAPGLSRLELPEPYGWQDDE